MLENNHHSNFFPYLNKQIADNVHIFKVFPIIDRFLTLTERNIFFLWSITIRFGCKVHLLPSECTQLTLTTSTAVQLQPRALLSPHCPSHPDTIMENFIPLFLLPFWTKSGNAIRNPFFTCSPTCFCCGISGFHHYPIHQPIKEGCSSLAEHNRWWFLFVCEPFIFRNGSARKYPKRSNLWWLRERGWEDLYRWCGSLNRAGLWNDAFWEWSWCRVQRMIHWN